MPPLPRRKRKRDAAAASSSSTPPPRYDIFLSFRGGDTRKTFTNHLLQALTQQGYYVFHDSKLKRGERIDSELLTAIEDSRLSIVVFSRNYADSRWCLDELAKIMDCRRGFQQIVLPVFYDVEPSDVRKQKGVFAEAFVDHERAYRIGEVRKWRRALNEAGNLSGLHLLNDANGDEAKFIAQIVKEVGNALNLAYLNVAYYPVGIESRVQELSTLLSLGTDDTRIVAIWGFGGIGKTTIAKALYNNIYANFEGSCFLTDVRGNSTQPNGVETLQKKLMSDIIKNEIFKIDNCDQGIELIKRRLWCRRVLIVLDDVDNVEQLKKLAINRNWFQHGSRIIVTTRDISCVKVLQVDAVYEPKELNETESLKLFNWYAFGQDKPKEGYEDLSKEVVNYAGGVPLVLEIWGPYIRAFKSTDQWRLALRKLKMIPHNDVQEKLKISFYSLDERQKYLFLDIACFFIQMDKELFIKVLEDDDSGCFPDIELEVLVNRCLVKTNKQGKLLMHDMVRDMGRGIVHQESFNNPGKRSRLWNHEDVLHVLNEPSGTEAIETITLELPESNKEQIDVNAFAKMSKLRLLRFSHLQLSGTYKHMNSLEKLKFLRWYGFPLTSIPSNLHMGNLVALDLQNSRLKQLWKGTKVLDRLRFLNVSHAHFLTSTPDFSGLKNLEKLVLRDCTNLIEQHNSIGSLDKLFLLDLHNCRSLTKVPVGIFQLKSLEDLNLSGCSKLDELAGFKVSFSNLWHLFLSVSFRQSWSRRRGSNLLLPGSAQGQSCLRRLSLNRCNLSYVPNEIGNLVSLKELELERNRFSSLPSTIDNLHRLQLLLLNKCVELKLITDLPRNLRVIEANDCRSLEMVSIGSQCNKGPKMHFSNCPKLLENNFAGTFHRNILHLCQGEASIPDVSISLAGTEIPCWFRYQGLGSFISFVAPLHINKTIRGWIVCVITSTTSGSTFIIGNVYNKTKNVHSSFVGCFISDQMWLSSVGLSKHGIVVESGDELEIIFTGTGEVKKSGLCLVYEGDTDEITESADQVVIEYSPVVDYEGNAVEYVSPDMLARVRPILKELQEFDIMAVIQHVKVLEGGGVLLGDTLKMYPLIASALYFDYVQGGSRQFLISEEDLSMAMMF